MKFVIAAIAALWAAGSAFAGITFCNKTNSQLQYVVAIPVTSPYRTNEIRGWFTLRPYSCSEIARGNFRGQLLHYYVSYADGSRRWIQKDRLVYQFCVRFTAFSRRGTWDQLQFSCPAGWAKLDFYRLVVPGANYELSFQD
jgi:uncharacterized membrane protein